MDGIENQGSNVADAAPAQQQPLIQLAANQPPAAPPAASDQPPAAPPAAAPQQLIQPDGNQPAGNVDPNNPPADTFNQENWRDVFPADVRDNPILAKYETSTSFLEGVQNMASMLGKKGLVMPDAGDEQAMNDFHAARGRPEVPTEYEWTPPKADDGSGEPIVDIGPEQLNNIKDAFHEMGVPKDIAPKILDFWAKDQVAAESAAQHAQAQQEAADIANLQKEWGNDFETNIKRVNAFMNRNNLAQDMIELGMANNAKMIKAAMNMINATGQTKQFDPVDPVTNKNVDQRVNEIMSSPAHQPGHPDYDRIHNELLDLLALKA